MTRRDFLIKSALAVGGIIGALGFRNVERVDTSAERVEEKPEPSTDSPVVCFLHHKSGAVYRKNGDEHTFITFARKWGWQEGRPKEAVTLRFDLARNATKTAEAARIEWVKTMKGVAPSNAELKEAYIEGCGLAGYLFHQRLKCG